MSINTHTCASKEIKAVDLREQYLRHVGRTGWKKEKGELDFEFIYNIFLF